MDKRAKRQLPAFCYTVNVSELLHRGKVRDVYLDEGDVLLVASDRVSVYDVVLPTPIPDKGKILTQLSLWWFDKLAKAIPHHVLSAEKVPSEFAGRAIRCRRLEMLPVECIARGYLAGLGLQEYEQRGSISDVELPSGLHIASKLPRPIFTPTTKEPVGTHDRPLSMDELAKRVGNRTALQLGLTTLELYGRAYQTSTPCGVTIADTKFEFGWDRDGTLTLADEILTPDSSRFWLSEDVREGVPPTSYDKQVVRDWAASTDWDRTAPGPEVPDDIVEMTRQRYLDIYERITGEMRA
jgi:phosphoribosylaminoimidazole-succinocarboxamide synthase